MEKNTKDSVDKYEKIVCPSAEELSVIVNSVRCVECGSSFSNEPRLRMHVLKIHEHKDLKKNVKEEVRYHCPDITCVYALKSQRYFTTMKYLKQHYLKVHAAKKFPCNRCDKSFSTEAASLAHLRVCGIQFTCSCLRVFGTYEALLTHGKRSAHSIDEKYKKSVVRKPRGEIAVPTRLLHVRSQRGGKPVAILPYRANGSYAPSGPVKISFDVGVQTEDSRRQKRFPSPSKTQKRRESRQTQTSLSSREKRVRKTVETQTTRNGDVKITEWRFRGRKEKSSFGKDLALTENFSSHNLFASSPLELENEEVGLDDFWEEKNTSLGTQTSPEKDFLEALTSSVTQTDLVAFYENKVNVASLTELVYPEDNGGVGHFFEPRISRSDPMLTIDSFTDRFSSIETQTEVPLTRRENFFDPGLVASTERNFPLSSNNETQTTENLDNIEQLLYSNTCTQTCNDILPSDLGLSDIQTQTAWPELEDSGTSAAETETRMSRCRNGGSAASASCRSWLNTRISHTETQTDLLSIFDEFT